MERKKVKNWYKILKEWNTYTTQLKKVINTIKQHKHGVNGDYVVLDYPCCKFSKDDTIPWNHLLSTVIPLNADDRIDETLKEVTNGRIKNYVIIPELDGKARLHYECSIK